MDDELQAARRVPVIDYVDPRWGGLLPEGWTVAGVMRWTDRRDVELVRIRDAAGVVRFEGPEAKARAWVKRGCPERVEPKMPQGWTDGGVE